MTSDAVTDCLVGKLVCFNEYHVRLGYSLSKREEHAHGFGQRGIIIVGEGVNEPCVVGFFRRCVVIFDASYQHGHNAFPNVDPSVHNGIFHVGRQQENVPHKFGVFAGENGVAPNDWVILNAFESFREFVTQLSGLQISL